MLNLQIERLRRLPQRKDETWQAAVFRMPMWVEDDSGHPARPWTALCVSTRTGLVGVSEPQFSAVRPAHLVLDALGCLAGDQRSGYRPARLEARPSDVPAELRPILADIGIEVLEQSELPALDEARQGMTRHFLKGRTDPAALGVSGVSIDHLRAFAQAAREFYEAAPWRHLGDEDLIEVAAPSPPKGLALATVMGAGGREYGLAFYDSRKQYERLFETDGPRVQFASRGVWSFTYGPIHELPFGDADAWEDHHLALAYDDAYPFFGRLGPGQKITRPTAPEWVFAEGLLRALALSTEPEMDQGRWSRIVPTLQGQAEYVLTLPALLEPVAPGGSPRRPGLPDRRTIERTLVDIGRGTEGMEFKSSQDFQRYVNKHFKGRAVPHQAARTPWEQAQDLVYEAIEAGGRRQLQLIRKALDICPDCADAYVLLAERAVDMQEVRDLYAQGVAAGERALGRRTFEEESGHFWGLLETRPYMRARYGLAYCCERLGQLQDAIDHYAGLLQLNPNDNQGVRYRLASCLAYGEDLDRFEAVLRDHDAEDAHWGFWWALWAFRKHGDGDESRRYLTAAHGRNDHVAKYLLGRAVLSEDQPDGYRSGDENEAMIIASEMIEPWKAAPGALSWLAEHTKAKPGQRRRRRK